MERALFQAQYTATWRGAASSGAAGQHAWLRSCYASMRPYASGQAYQNYIDPDLRNPSAAYYGANYPRLQRVKATYDPGQLFSFPGRSLRMPSRAVRRSWWRRRPGRAGGR